MCLGLTMSKTCRQVGVRCNDATTSRNVDARGPGPAVWMDKGNSGGYHCILVDPVGSLNPKPLGGSAGGQGIPRGKTPNNSMGNNKIWNLIVHISHGIHQSISISCFGHGHKSSDCHPLGMTNPVSRSTPAVDSLSRTEKASTS